MGMINIELNDVVFVGRIEQAIVRMYLQGCGARTMQSVLFAAWYRMYRF